MIDQCDQANKIKIEQVESSTFTSKLCSVNNPKLQNHLLTSPTNETSAKKNKFLTR